MVLQVGALPPDPGGFTHRSAPPTGLPALGSAAGFLRSVLAKRITTHMVPELHFHYDASVERGVRLSQLIDDAVSGRQE